jgi:hypothetical protein
MISLMASSVRWRNVHGDQGFDDFEADGVFHVDAETLFAAILLNVVCAAAVFKERRGTTRVTAGASSNFDDLGSHLSHHSRRGRPKSLSEVEDLIAV